jgi:hypothetical protein
MNVKFHKTLKSAAISSLLASGAVAASLISAEPAKAQFIGVESQSRVSAAVTSILSNGVTNSFAAEIVFPETAAVSNGVLDLEITYAVPSDDNSQVVIEAANMTAGVTDLSLVDLQTVEAATARAIDAATDAIRFGDIIGIVQQWQSGGSAALD